MKSLKWLLMFSLLLAPFAGGHVKTASADGTPTDTLVLTLRSNVIVHNGVVWKSTQPLTIYNGTGFVEFRAISARYGYKVSYNPATKESIATSGEHELRFKPGSAIVEMDGTMVKASGATYILNGSLMVPLRAWSEITGSKLTIAGTKMTLTWQRYVQPTADFEVQPAEIFAGQTQVTYVDHSTNSTGQPFVADIWQGNLSVFPEPGTYTITRQVEDVNGQWSQPYSVTIEVKAPNQPPVADFSTDKPSYRIGEPIMLNDLSTDDQNAIVRRTWTVDGKTYDTNPPQLVYFEPGDKTITLQVEDSQGLVGSVTKTVTVTSEVLYTQDEYNKLFTKAGDKFPIDGSSVLNMKALSYKIQSDNSQMVLSDNPEALVREGIIYEAQLTGQARFMFYNMNKMSYPVKMYLVATNKNGTTVNVSTTSSGLGGPAPSVYNTGKMSTLRYLSSYLTPPASNVVSIKPGQSKIIYDDLHQIPMKPGDVLSAYADIYSDQEVVYDVVVVAANEDPIQALPNLSIMEKDNLHVRGTFNNANRLIEIDDTLGTEPELIKLGDSKIDQYLTGIDETTGELQLNYGNFGCMYTLRMPHVAPHTLISLNARGGYYTGGFIVNGQVVPVTENSILKDNSEAAVLYRTGDTQESVEIAFTLAAGSNLPIALLLSPLPATKY
ncbi:stalk domain-containing protein [Paenibacillus humicola]|uniref:stalk domain-containing protein n=1 Tax=Paenibacillus humicola TaxID=3110540 RepID=UPI00237AE01A|nr:stalk domain-containing protein [Paenibacillus humicola]